MYNNFVILDIIDQAKEVKDQDNGDLKFKNVEIEDKSKIEDICAPITEEELNAFKNRNKSKKKKPKQKSVTKALKEEEINENPDMKLFECKVCGAKYPSNTKLFLHIKEKGHAVLKEEGKTKKKKNKRNM